MEHSKIAAFLGLLAVANLATAAPKNSVYEETKATVSEWAKTENLISKELNDWKTEKAILENLEQMLSTEKETLLEKIEASRASATEAEKQREEIVARKEALEEASAVVREKVSLLEDQVRELVPYFPANYLESIGPLLRQLPKKGQETQLSLSVRMRNVIGLLSQANKFDNVISLETETRSFEGGTSKQVKTLYFGFSIAYYSDATGENAGYGTPTANGWTWERTPEYGEAILDAISMYEKGQQAAFVTLPVVIK